MRRDNGSFRCAFPRSSVAMTSSARRLKLAHSLPVRHRNRVASRVPKLRRGNSQCRSSSVRLLKRHYSSCRHRCVSASSDIINVAKVYILGYRN